MNAIRPAFARTFAMAGALLLASTGIAHADAQDKLEPINRGVNAFNYNADKITLRPAATAYEKGVPSVVRTGVSNFFGNLGDPWSAINNLLQFKLADAAQDTGRFAMNTVFGFAGLLDLASQAGIERRKADFGMTLAHWGVPSGPYVELPLLGPSTLRDALAFPVDLVGSPIKYVSPVTDRNVLLAGRVLDVRARALPIDPMLDTAIDRYTLTRDMYLQHRQAEIAGEGEPDKQESATTTEAGPQGAE
jgi:phospholipid-binding lipoprotein MlaA